ncbi:MAG: hypothetical protein QMC62_09640 [Alteromonadaceae bacterium]
MSSVVVIFNTSTTAKTVNFKKVEQYQIHTIQQNVVNEIVKQNTINKTVVLFPL